MVKAKEGDILFVRGRGIVNSIIRFVTRGKVSHVAYFWSERDIIETNWGEGVAMNPSNKYNPKKHKLWIGTIKTANKEDIAAISKWMARQIGEKYDKMQILNMLFCRITGTYNKETVMDNKKLDVCSSLIGEAAETRNIIPKKNVATSNLSPQDLFDSEIVDVREYKA